MADFSHHAFDTKDSALETENGHPDITSCPKKEKTSNIFDSFKSHVSQKSKLEIFQKLNKTMASDEVLINDFSCVLHKDIPVHGRLYLSQYALTFYANTLGWERTISMKWTEMDAITREKSAKLIPNAVQIMSRHQTYFFSGFLVREEAYTSMVRVWQNARMGFPMLGGDLKVLCNKRIPLLNDEAAQSTSLPEEGRYEKIYEMLKNQYDSATDKQYKIDKDKNNILLNTSNSIRNQIKDKRNNLSNAISGKISQVRMMSSLSNTNNSINKDTKLTTKSSQNQRMTTSVDSIIESMRSKVASRNASTDDHATVLRNRTNTGNIGASENQNDADKYSNTTQHDTSPSFQSVPIRKTSGFDPIMFSTGSLLDNATPPASSNLLLSSSNTGPYACSDDDGVGETLKELEVEEEEDIEAECSCQNCHEGDEYLNETFDISVEDLYQRLFSQDSETMRALFDGLKYDNVKFTPLMREEDGSHSQTLAYTIPLSFRQCNTTTKHIMLNTNTPGRFHVVDVTSHTEGVPYGGAFHVHTRYCLTKCLGANRSRLRVTSDVVFRRSIFGFAKNMITSNASKGLTEYIDLLVNLLRPKTHNCGSEHEVVSPVTANSVQGPRGNFRDISGIIQRIKDYKIKMLSEQKNNASVDENGEKVKQRSTSTYSIFISIFLTSVVFYILYLFILIN